ncbi:hypothetical protein VOLCADRAFT_121074 [Volvox carteri f. nagariensis]|uniref:EF-hand domain-containing protein n=1 Tax=Volvox carteri f. nagariensis TaxID=3068 RepID=D8U1W7_VOLCA|nr:uncharacterized protein VOLCADRAFT_121074 [Volvox carteri f. nagariensis]EFJ46253.1 hypothetical protein VOLCADRAFT_121074 [Volvox carteri f. nagariensis]|eukprot:XP_002952700.1 hypothetical protein VOLCADRAFT_121074 [Volvox carteri f. nagariensis]
MALIMDASVIRDLTARSPPRQDSASGAPPFSHSRLRGYAGRMEGMLEPKVLLGSSIALTAAGLADPLLPLAGGSSNSHSNSPRTLAPVQPPTHAIPHTEQQQLAGAAGAAGALRRHSGGDADGGELQPQSPQASQQQQQLGGGHHARFAPAPSAVYSAPGSTGSSSIGGGGGGGLHPSSRFVPPGQLSPVPAAAASPLPATAAASSAAAAANPDDLAAALSQIQALKAEIAGVETVLGYLKGSEIATTTMGRKAHKLPSQEQLRARAEALTASRASARFAGAAAASTITATSTDSLLLTSPPPRGGIHAGGGGGGGGSAAGTPARARSAGDAPAKGPSGTTAVFDTLAAETKLGRTWRVPRGPQPMGRGEAVVLEAALDEALPAGAITAKYGSGATVELSFWSGGDVRQDFEMLEMVQREVARQVSASCVERGRIVEKLADRFSEIFVAVVAAARTAAEAQRRLTGELTTIRARAGEQAAEIATLRSGLAARGAEAEDLREQLLEATTAHEHYVWDTEQELEQLQGQADILAAEVEHLHVRLSEAVAEKDAALSRGLERVEGDLAAVTDERDDLAQRIRFLERQLHKLRTEMSSHVDSTSAEVQTDPVEWGPQEQEDVPDDCSDTPSLAEIRARYTAHGYGALTPEERLRLGLPPHMGSETNKEHKGRKRRRALGHFEGLISSDKPGRVRGLPWTMNVISAIYYDKLQADSVSDRECNPRQRLAEFAVDWHMTRFGLRNLAELHLLDLIASVRQHYKTSVRVRWFGQFTGLVEVGDSVDTTPHVSFYLTVLSQLAAPNSLVSLFPDTGGEEGGGTPPVAIKAAGLPEATRAVFRYLGEPEGAVPFLARSVDPITDPISQLVPLDPLVALFMAEYQKRWERNAAHLRALFRAGDYDDDGLIGYDEFAGIIRQMLPDAAAADRLAPKIYGDAMRRLPDGQSMLDADTFLAAARAFGWDRWRVEVGPAGPIASYPSGISAKSSAPPANWAVAAATTSPAVAAAAPPPPAVSASPSTASVLPVGGAAGAAAATATGSRPSSGAITRSESAMARTALGAASMKAMAVAAAAVVVAPPAPPMAPLAPSYSRAISNLRREESVVGLTESDRALLRVLDGALEGLDPPLDDQVSALLDKLRGAVAAAQQQAAVAAAAAAAVPGLEMMPSTKELTSAIAADSVLLSKLEAQYTHFRTVYGERTDPAAAWLAFRLLMASLAAATAGSRARLSRSRPGSAKGTVAWGLPRSVMRLTVPPLPFRAGSSSRALNSGGGSGVSRRNTPQSALGYSLGAGLGAAAAGGSGAGGSAAALAGVGSLPQVPSGVSGSSSFYGGGSLGGGGGEGSVASGVGLAAPSPLSRSASRSPMGLARSTDAPPGRPMGLVQVIQGGNSFSDRHHSPSPLVVPSPTTSVQLHRMPLPTTLSARGGGPGTPTAAAGGGGGAPGGASTPTKRGVVFSFGSAPPTAVPQPAAAAAAVAAASVSSDGLSSRTPWLERRGQQQQEPPPPPQEEEEEEEGEAPQERAAAAEVQGGGDGGGGGGIPVGSEEAAVAPPGPPPPPPAGAISAPES